MQVALVAYYGKKPKELIEYIQQLQDRLTLVFPNNCFCPYPIAQVHGTLIGMEGVLGDKTILNKNFYELRGELRTMDIDGALRFIRITSILPIHIRVGGFKKSKDYPFTSRGMHPYYRSFSIQRNNVVAMGWPIKSNGTYPTSLHHLRQHFQKHNILHKYLGTDNDIDNDFYMVLGKTVSSIHDTTLANEAEDCLRSYLAAVEPFFIPLDRDNFSIVYYTSDMLPQETSLDFSVTSESLDAQFLQKLYISI
jgi:hypothetical protein